MVKKLAFLFMLILHTGCIFAADEFYKYVDKNGDTIISNNLPAEYANNGYAIVTSRGNVLKIVAPKKTNEELAQELSKEKAAFEEKLRIEKQEAEKKEQARRDDILLKTFASETDIIRNRDDKINAIEVLESITKENITRLKKQLDEAQSTAARHERSGKLTPQSVIETINISKRQIHENFDFLMQKQEEKEQLKIKYEKMIERFKVLQ